LLLARRLKGAGAVGNPSRSSERHRTQQQLRDRRQEFEQRGAELAERHRFEEQVRQHRHDALAKTICAGEFPERRRFRSDRELREQRTELENEWESRQRLRAK